MVCVVRGSGLVVLRYGVSVMSVIEGGGYSDMSRRALSSLL